MTLGADDMQPAEFGDLSPLARAGFVIAVSMSGRKSAKAARFM